MRSKLVVIKVSGRHLISVICIAGPASPERGAGFEDAVGPATWPPSTSTLINDDGDAPLVDCLIR
jgi:hypothetical protein